MTSNNLYIHEISLYIHQFYEKKFLTNAEMERSNITPLEIIAPAVQENTLSNHITYCCYYDCGNLSNILLHIDNI